MDDILEKIQNRLKESGRRLNQYRQDTENVPFRFFSNLLIAEITDIINEFTNNLDKQKCNENDLKNQMVEYIFGHVKILARNMASNEKQFEILQKIFGSESTLTEKDIVDINYCLQVVDRNIDLLKEFKGKNQIKMNEFQHKRSSIKKIADTSHKFHNKYLFSAIAAAIIPLIAHLVVSEQLNPIIPLFSVSISFTLLIYHFSKAFNHKELLNSNDEDTQENEDTKSIFKRFETMKSIKNLVENVLSDENQRKNNLNICKSFLEESSELKNNISEILNIKAY
jgi:hypothetical protein